MIDQWGKNEFAIGGILSLWLLLAIACTANGPGSTQDKEELAAYEDIRIKEFPLAVQCYTFRNFTFLETLEKVKELGIENIQAWPGQVLGLPGDHSEAKSDHHMSADQIKAVKGHLKRLGLRLVAYGVVEDKHLVAEGEVKEEDKEAAWRKVFAFAREMGIETVVMEPAFEDISLIEKLADEYFVDELADEKGLEIAIHNHTQPNKYARPETVLSHIEGRSRRIGACADNGHWMRDGIVPTDALRLLSGRIRDVHLTDLNEFGSKEAFDVPLGTGKADVRSILAELTIQNYSGYLTIEYENEENALNPLPAIRESLEFIKSVTYYSGYKEILYSRDGWYTKHGWNHYGPGYFTLDNKTGILTAHGGRGLFWYNRKYKDFILELDFRVEHKADNSGIFYRVPEMPVNDTYIFHSFEVQIDGAAKGIHTTGGVYDAVAPTPYAAIELGAWNHYKITCRGANIIVELNGETVVDWEMEPRGKIRDFAEEGYIGLQNHDDQSPVQFRNLFIREL